MKKNSVTEDQIDELLWASTVSVSKVGDNTTLVFCTLPCGWRFVESSSCVDPDNYDHELGKNICMKRIKEKLWELEGYRLMNELHEKRSRKLIEWNVKKVFVNFLEEGGGEDGWYFYAESSEGETSDEYFKEYDEAVAWIADRTQED